MRKSLSIAAVFAALSTPVMASDYTYTSSFYINIPAFLESGPADVYPVTFDVKELGRVTDVNISLNGLISPYLGDIVAGLRAPDGTSVYFLGGAGGQGSTIQVSLSNYIFDSQAALAIPEFPDPAVPPGTYKESVYRTDGYQGNSDPLGLGNYTKSLTSFNGIKATGTWQLYLFDQYDGDKSQLRGATLSLTTSAVPEPVIWSMLITGFGAVGTSLRRSRPAPARISV